MSITILNYESNERNFRKGFVDLKISYSVEKSEIFRGVGYFVKDNRRWLSLGAVKRNEKWLPIYERTPKFNPLIFSEALKALDQYFVNLRPSALEAKPDINLF